MEAEDKNKEKEKKAILAKLTLLANLRRQHEWTVVGRAEAEVEEEAESEIDAEASGSPPEQSEGEQ